MSQEMTKEQQLEQQAIILKARAFDAQEALGQAQASIKVLQDALVKIATAVGVSGEEITIDSIVAAVEELAPAQGALDLEEAQG